MKIVAVMGSPRGMKGNTGKLLAGVISACKTAGADVETFELGKMKVAPCLGCGECHKTGRCVIKDDYERVNKAMTAADGVILASPNYINSVTAQMKCLFDRFTCVLHCQAFEGKHGIAVVTSGGPDSAEVEQYTLQFLRNLGCWTVGSIGAEARHVVDEKMRDKTLDAAAKLGSRFVEAIRDKETYPEQRQAQRAFYERLKMIITRNKEAWAHEYNYWKSKGRI